jgi:hypothetical protein
MVAVSLDDFSTYFGSTKELNRHSPTGVLLIENIYLFSPGIGLAASYCMFRVSLVILSGSLQIRYNPSFLHSIPID